MSTRRATDKKRVFVLLTASVFVAASVTLLFLRQQDTLTKAFVEKDDRAIRFLKGGTEGAEKKLIDGLKHSNPVVRIGCMRLLLTEPYNADIKSIVGLLSDSEPAVRVAVLETLAEHARSNTEVVELISARLSDKSAAVRIAAMKALNRALGRDCRGIVEPLLSDGEGAVRLTAASILGEYGEKRAIGVLIELLDDRGCAQTAFLLLRRWTGLTFNFDKETTEEGRSVSIKRWRHWWQKNQKIFIFRR